MKTFKTVIPSIFTSFNLLAGFIAIIIASREGVFATFFIVIAACFDFIDGAFARLLKAESKFGKNLDSFADIVSFGIAPGIIIYQLLRMSLIEIIDPESASITQNIILYSSFIIVFSAAVRLSVFNISENQKNYFRGLPTPASALFIASIWLTMKETEITGIREIILNPYFIVLTTIVLFVLSISNIRMISMKFSNRKFKGNIFRYIMVILILSFIIMIIAGCILKIRLEYFGIGLSLLIVLYIILSVLENLICKAKE